ncbi:hypothetical protein Taro_044101 [Colocasia esculenta]|uniref:Uncharacterized protein n=1 Tax=Colocasia esculenta TaxID=4460 RepID=A0A843WXF9_COLES|nr:hypothetical protein [Colocasia esculenta]
MSRRAMRDNGDEPGSDDSNPERTEVVERKRATRSRGQAPRGGSGSRGNTGTTSQIGLPTGYFLNPRLMYADNAHVDSKVLHGTLNVNGHLSMTPKKRLEAELQVLLLAVAHIHNHRVIMDMIHRVTIDIVHRDKVTMDMIHRGTMDMTHRGTMNMIQVMVPLEVANMRQECMGGLVNLNSNFNHFQSITVIAQYPLLMLGVLLILILDSNQPNNLTPRGIECVGYIFVWL